MIQAPEYMQKESWFRAIADELADGRSLTTVLNNPMREQDFPNSNTLYHWMKRHPEFKLILEEGRERGMEKLVEEIVEIADTVEAKNKAEIAKARLRIYAREKMAVMMAPKRFKNSVDITSDGEKIEAASPVLVDNRIQSLIAIAMERRAQRQTIDVTPKPDPKSDLLDG